MIQPTVPAAPAMQSLIQTVEVLLFRGMDTYYTYKIPQDMLDVVQPGVHVVVPLGNARVSGVIMARSGYDESKKSLKTILEIDLKKPILSSAMRTLITWFHQHYLCTPFKAYQTIIGNRKLRETSEEKIQKESDSKIEDPNYTLTTEQDHAITTILKQTQFTKCLIHGITSSGKTEVYIRLIQAKLAQNQNVILLLPEIALTPQFRKEFKKRFGNQIAVIHSGLTPKKRDEAWNQIARQEVKIVLGPRSAIFSPFPDLGMIIIDEEHESSYKQDTHPRYNTHTIAEYRCQHHNCVLVLGSATPTIESYYHATQQNGLLLSMTHRAKHQPLPSVTLSDLTDETLVGSDKRVTPILVKKLEETLKKKQKAIILINRRGYAPYIVCQHCKQVLKCPKCQLSVTYHKDRSLRCHRCCLQFPITNRCPSCKRNALQFSGIGIQKIELELTQLFPNHTIIRLDRDTAKTLKESESIMDRFRESGDILIGTQMIAKGHHIQDVTLVGVIGIDTVLNIPDFRSPERAFQLLTQVAGRAGRGDNTGEVIIQTAQTNHYAVQHAIHHNFISFYDEEIEYRKALAYPPFSSLINIIISAISENEVKKSAMAIGKFIQKHPIFQSILKDQSENPAENPHEAIQMIGPTPAPIEKINTHFRWHILIKTPHQYVDKLREVLAVYPKQPEKVRVIMDFDPRSLL